MDFVLVMRKSNVSASSRGSELQYAIDQNFKCSHNIFDHDISSKYGMSYCKSQKTLTLECDEVGLRPLYYFIDNQTLLISDSLERLLNYLPAIRRIDFDSIGDFLLFGNIDKARDTLLKDVKRTLPYEVISFNSESWKLMTSFPSTEQPLWSIDSYEDAVVQNEQRVQTFTSELLNGKYSSKHGLLLSGGIDSSVLAGILGEKLSKQQLSFFTLKNEIDELDEYSYAKLLTDQYEGYKSHVITADLKQFVEEIESLHKIIEWPTLSAGTFNQYALLKSCNRNEIEFVWDGLGADAIYGGHDYYRFIHLKELLTTLKLLAAAELLAWKGSFYKELKVYFKYIIKSGILKHKDFFKAFLKYQNEMKIYNPTFIKRSIEFHFEKKASNSDLATVMSSDFFRGGVSHLSRFTDKISKYFGLNMLYPYAQNVSLAKDILSLPGNMLFRGGMSKAILRDSFRSQLPPQIYRRKDKKGLPSPNNLWIDEYKDHWIGYMTDELVEIYDVDYIKANYQKWWSIKDKSENFRHFRHISFAIWYKIWMKNVSKA